MSKFKVGDKVVRVSRLPQFIDAGGSRGVFTVRSENAYTLTFKEIECQYFNSSFFELAQDEWNIYNNDKPLSELSDEQRGLLVNYLFSNGDVQTFNGEVWLDMLSGFNLINREFIYRAKQKSERELFVEAALSATKPFSMDVGIVKAIAEDMFKAGFEAPKTDK
jgi:hypothetical protein